MVYHLRTPFALYYNLPTAVSRKPPFEVSCEVWISNIWSSTASDKPRILSDAVIFGVVKIRLQKKCTRVDGGLAAFCRAYAVDACHGRSTVLPLLP